MKVQVTPKRMKTIESPATIETLCLVSRLLKKSETTSMNDLASYSNSPFKVNCSVMFGVDSTESGFCALAT